MERPFVRLGAEKPDGAAFAASGCSSMLDFLSSPLLCNGAVRHVMLTQDKLPGRRREGWLYFSAKGVRDREEARDAGSFVRFLHALPTSLSSCTCLSVYDVELVSEEELSALCSAISSPLCTLCELRIKDLTIQRMSSADAAQTLVTDALFNNTSLRFLTLYIASEVCSPKCLIPALARTPCSIKHLQLNLTRAHRTCWDELSGILRGLTHNTISLQTFHIFNYLSSHEKQNLSFDLIDTMLCTNTSLQSLGLIGCHLPGEVVRKLFASLEQNAHLTSLSLEGCGGPDWPSASFVLDFLRVNGTLSTLNLIATPLAGKSAAAIAAQLARNKQRVEEQMPALKSKGSALVPPNAVRLFLCGLPYAGKTTLCRSLVKWNTAGSCFGKCLPCAQISMPERTRGIEVSSLEKDGVKVSLWDLAGQPEYYAFHDRMFPNLSNDATPSLFLFVWNPIQLTSIGKEIKDEHGRNTIKTPEMFELEFRYWLRFITSKTLKSLKFKPKIFLAITRADLLQFNIRSCIQNTFNSCQNDFEENIQFDTNGVFAMNATDPREVNSLALHIFCSATSILKSKPLVYEACNQTRRVLAELVRSKPLAPLVTKQEFFLLCRRHLGLDSKEMQEAVALSLNESGDLIYFEELELVVVDTQWFCHRFMGDLLYFSNNTNPQRRGFFPPQHLEDLLESKVNATTVHCKQLRTFFVKTTRRSPTIKGKALVKLLIGLRLACRQNDNQVNSDIFIPISLCTKQKRSVGPRQFLKGAEGNILTFMGRRLKCKDSVCTFFTPGIFSILQVTFHNLLHDREVLVQLEEDVMAFAFGGVKVFMEFCRLEGKDHFIDILVASSKESLDDTIEWLQENVLLDVEKICAEPRGIQGVELAHAVIQQTSIQNFLEASRRPAVLIEELQDELKNNVEKKGVYDGIKTAMYTWQIDNFPSNSVVDLLGEKETSKVIQTYLHALGASYREISNLFVEDVETSQPQKPQFGMSQSSKEREIIYDKFCQVEQNVMRELKDLKHSIQDLHDAVQELRNAVLPKLCKLFTFVEEGEAGKLPRMFMVTEDNGLVRRVVSAIVPSLQNVRLQLFCECCSESCHFVDGKRGMSLAKLDEGLLKRGLPYINAILKVACMVARIGAHVAVGFGDVIPDFTQVLANIVDAHVWDNWTDSSRVNLKEGQQWLFDVLSNNNCTKGDQIYAVFGLRRVRLPDSRAAWVCDKHYREGKPWPA